MRGVLSTLVAVALLSSARSHANELQSNASTSRCKPYPPCGMQGMPGTNGIPGIPGAPGSPGRDGFKGGKGTTGKRGLQGPVGIPGKMGPRGPEGPKGESGENGTTGIKGSAGIPGNPGLRGFKGPKGNKGEKGEIGLMGMKGSTGIPGNSGPRGLNGPKGKKGEIDPVGIPGNSGPRGPKGDKGVTANIDPRQLANWKQCVWKETSTADNGKIKECFFNKLYSNTALKVSYQGNIRVYINSNSNNACNRWYLKFNGNECSGPMTIDSVLFTNFNGQQPVVNRNHFLEGYCENIARGTVTVELWVGKCSGTTEGNAYTGWNSVSRIMIEEVPPSQ